MRLKLIAITWLLFLAPANTHATISEYLSSAEGDPAFEMLGKLFGPVPGVIPGTPSPLSEMFIIFNMAVFSVAVLMVLYGVLSGVMHTAVDGEFLGKRHSSIWYPIRVIYGIFGLVPIFGGWSFPQALMILGMVVGIGVGNLTWEAGWQFMLGHVDSLVLTNPEAAAKDDTIEALITAQICSLSHNNQQKEDFAQSGKPEVLFSEEGKLVKDGNQTKLIFGSSSPGYLSDSCGGVVVLSKLGSKGVLEGPQGWAAMEPFDEVAVAEAQAKGLSEMSAALLPYSKSLFRDGQTPDPQALAKIKNEYTLYVSSALARASADSRSGFSQWMQNEGSSWIYAGAIFLKMVAVNRQIIDAASAEIMPILPSEAGPIEQGMSVAAGVVKGWLKSVKSFVSLDFAKIFGDSMESAGVQGALNLLTNGETDLLTGICGLGYALSAAAGVGMGISAGLAAVPSGAGVLEVLGLPALFKILLIVGVAMAYLLPFLPFIIWFGGVVSYFIVLIEAVVGAPLWMLAHLETEGEGLGQKTSHGYMFLLNVLFRPVLMVIGLISGWLLVNILGQFLKYSLSVLYGSSSFSFSGWAAIGSFFMTLIIFCYLSYMLISRCFSLIHHLPNEVLAWVGGHVGKIGGGEDERAINAIYAGGREVGNGFPPASGGAKNAIQAGGPNKISAGSKV